MRKVFFILFILSLFVSPFIVGANNIKDNSPKITAKFSADTIMIGDQPIITVSVSKDVTQRVFFPEFDKEMTKGIELISIGKVDTVREEGSREVKLTRDYKVVIFDAGHYNLKGFPLILVNGDKVDTLLTEPLHIFVETYVIDTLTQKIYDIKAPIDAPLQFAEVSLYVYLGLLGLAIIAIIILIIIRLRNKKSLLSRTKLPPHIIAVAGLEKIKEQMLWQNGKHKEYYTSLTDIIREYLDGRFGKSAKEMTTEEIMVSIKEDNIEQKDKDVLYDMLALADLVKFAKMTPDMQDNEDMYQRAIDFIDHTKSSEEAVVEQVEESELNNESNKANDDVEANKSNKSTEVTEMSEFAKYSEVNNEINNSNETKVISNNEASNNIKKEGE